MRFGLSNQTLFQILFYKVNIQILSMMIESKNFPYFLDYAGEAPEVFRGAIHDINRMNAEKITFSEASMIRLRDIMMSILKNMKEAYASKSFDIDSLPK